jgi:nitroreductase
MELYDVMRTTFAAREFTDDPLPDPVLYRILDNARFAPSGGNRQGTHIVAVRDPALRERLGDLNVLGYGGTLTTMAVPEEMQIRDLLGIPDTHAVAALVPVGKPKRQLSKLRRRPVEEFTTRDRFDGAPLRCHA